MNKIRGYRTLTAMALSLVFSIMTYLGIMVPANDQAAITGGVIAIVGIILRYLTDSPVGGPVEEIKPMRKTRAKK